MTSTIEMAPKPDGSVVITLDDCQHTVEWKRFLDMVLLCDLTISEGPDAVKRLMEKTCAS